MPTVITLAASICRMITLGQMCHTWTQLAGPIGRPQQNYTGLHKKAFVDTSHPWPLQSYQNFLHLPRLTPRCHSRKSKRGNYRHTGSVMRTKPPAPPCLYYRLYSFTAKENSRPGVNSPCFYKLVLILVGNGQLRGGTDEPSCNTHVS